MMSVLIFKTFIADLPCHVVTFKIAVCVSYDVLKYKTDDDFK